MDNLAPIILFVYNRPDHTKRTMESLLKNNLASTSRLFVFSDGAKNNMDEQKVKAVRDYIRAVKGFNKIEIVLREKNYGLANSVISGITEVFKQDDQVIVIEDDIISLPTFLTFMNKALAFYQDNKSIYSISGYPYPIKIPSMYKKDIFISYRTSSWGWGTWKDRWEKVDWEITDFKNFIADKESQKIFNRAGEDLVPMLKAQMNEMIDSWAIRWSYAHFKNKAYCLYPVVPLCKNIGTDKSGTHSSSSKKLDVSLEEFKKDFDMIKNPELNDEITELIQRLFRLTLTRKIINYFKFS